MFYAKVDFSTHVQLSSSFRPDMTPDWTSKSASIWSTCWSLQRCFWHPKVKKLPLQPHNKHSRIAIFFAMYQGAKVIVNRNHLGCPDKPPLRSSSASASASSASRKPLARRKSTAAAWRPTWKGWMKFSIGWLLVWEACWQIQEMSPFMLSWTILCLPHKAAAKGDSIESKTRMMQASISPNMENNNK